MPRWLAEKANLRKISYQSGIHKEPLHLWHWVKGIYPSCPWCSNRESGNPIPRPPVACRECLHWSPDKINPPGGLGSRAIRTPANRPAGAYWPRGEIRCAD